VAEHVELEDTFVGLVASRQVSGKVTILFDARAAIVFGLVAGMVSGLFRLLIGRRG
jgi:hypothetical protein